MLVVGKSMSLKGCYHVTTSERIAKEGEGKRTVNKNKTRRNWLPSTHHEKKLKIWTLITDFTVKHTYLLTPTCSQPNFAKSNWAFPVFHDDDLKHFSKEVDLEY